MFARPSGFCIRSAGLLFLLIASAGVIACRRSSEPPRPFLKWTAGFWFWNGSSALVSAGAPVDVIYCQIGPMATQQLMDLPQYWAAFERLPAELPTAKEYWL